MENKNYNTNTTKGNTNMDFYPLRNGQVIPSYVSKGGVWATIKAVYAKVDAVTMMILFAFETLFLSALIVMLIRGL